MQSYGGRFHQKASSLGATVLAVLVALTCFGMARVARAEKGAAGEEKSVLDPKKFGRSTTIDNKWFPLKPGTQHVYRGHTRAGNKRVPHSVVFTVTDLTKVIDGVRTVVCFDRDYKAGRLVEPELIFFAQDNDGNVWLLGEYREIYEDTEYVGGQAWLAGMEGARAGIMMKAEPRAGMPSYSEGYAPPPLNWSDGAKVEKMGQKACVPAGCYDDVLVIAEFSHEEGPDAKQIKYYAPGVGPVRIGWRGKGEKTRETLELTAVVQLDPEALAKVRADALELEKRASMYGQTSPPEHAAGEDGHRGSR
jgi:hypothetical protein